MTKIRPFGLVLVALLFAVPSFSLVGPFAATARASALAAPDCVQVGNTCEPLLDLNGANCVGAGCPVASPTPNAAPTPNAGTTPLDASQATCQGAGCTTPNPSSTSGTLDAGAATCVGDGCSNDAGTNAAGNLAVDCNIDPNGCAAFEKRKKDAVLAAAAATEAARAAAVPNYGTAECPIIGDAQGNPVPGGICDSASYQANLREAISLGRTCWTYTNEQRELSPCALGAATANAPPRPALQGPAGGRQGAGPAQSIADNELLNRARQMESSTFAVTLDPAKHFGALGAPALKWPNGGEKKIQLMVGWLKWMGLAAGVVGLIICGIMMIIGRRGRSQTAVEGAAGIPWVLGGLAVVSMAATVVGAWTTVGAP